MRRVPFGRAGHERRGAKSGRSVRAQGWVGFRLCLFGRQQSFGADLDEKTLDTYLTNPMKMVPGTKMTFAGLPDPAQRKAVIDYLKTLK